MVEINDFITSLNGLTARVKASNAHFNKKVLQNVKVSRADSEMALSNKADASTAITTTNFDGMLSASPQYTTDMGKKADASTAITTTNFDTMLSGSTQYKNDLGGKLSTTSFDITLGASARYTTDMGKKADASTAITTTNFDTTLSASPQYANDLKDKVSNGTFVSYAKALHGTAFELWKQGQLNSNAIGALIDQCTKENRVEESDASCGDCITDYVPNDYNDCMLKTDCATTAFPNSALNADGDHCVCAAGTTYNDTTNLCA